MAAAMGQQFCAIVVHRSYHAIDDITMKTDAIDKLDV